MHFAICLYMTVCISTLQLLHKCTHARTHAGTPSNCCRRAARVHKHNGFTLCAAVTAVALTVNLTLIKGAVGTSQEPRQGYEPP